MIEPREEFQPRSEPPFNLVIPAEAGIHGLDFSEGSKCGYFYVMSSDRNGTLYVGVTSNLLRRVAEHKQGIFEGFTKRYAIHRLVYFEQFESVVGAIEREKQVKKWKRAWKIELINAYNPDWLDLYEGLAGG
jgi:putative endonuclease